MTDKKVTEAFTKVLTELFEASEPSVKDIWKHLKNIPVDGEKFDPRLHKIHLDKWSEIVNKCCEELTSDERSSIMLELANIGPSMYQE